MITDRIEETPGTAPVVARTDVVVVGGGPAGFAAAVAGAREGASVTLLERYPYLGGLASGGMVLVLDDMHNGDEITVTGICMEMIERMARGRRLRLPAAGGPRAELGTCTGNGRAGARSTSAPRPSRSRSSWPPPSIPTAGSASPTR